MRKAGLVFSWFFLLGATWVVAVLHLGVFPPAALPLPEPVPGTKTAHWIPKEKAGVHHLILEGSPYARGRAAGEITSQLVERQEVSLVQKLEGLMPNRLIRSGFTLALMRWFWGVDRYLESWTTEEMQGIADFASPRFDHYADRLTRQVAYHGLHEVGQFFVDRGGEGMGCTVLLLPTARGWAIGRNFDFEGGRVFDEEKIVKWVFPDEGLSFVSVIWAGMVGAVTGVNEKGVYLSLNAAGSRDFRRYGTPSTLVALKALQFAPDADAAKRIIEESTMFITDIFVVSDGRKTLVIEKSPRRFDSRVIEAPTAIANHLSSPLFAGDETNRFRRDELTSRARETRGTELVTGPQAALPVERRLLNYLRDKKAPGGKPLHLGNRGAIDALIATHAVIYHSELNRLYVSQGPALVGPFRGYDLKRSFALHRPVEVTALPADPEISAGKYAETISGLEGLHEVGARLRKKDCRGASDRFSLIRPFEHASYYKVQGDLLTCLGEAGGARDAYTRALELQPPYEAERRELKEKVAR